MRFPARLTARLAFVLLSTTLARADLQFVGILATRETTRFALLDTSTGRTDWKTAHTQFAGYTITSFDAKTDTLTLTRDGADLKLRLIDDAKIKDSRLELSGAITLGVGDEKLEVLRATLLYDQENLFPLKDGTVYKIKPTREPDNVIRYAVEIEKTTGTRTERVSAPQIRTRAGQPFKISVGDYTFDFTPR